MSWLRLPDFDAGEPELVHDDAGNLVEVLVRCRPTKAEYEWCCFNRKVVRNGTVEVRYRDRRIEPAPTWLVVTVQKIRCPEQRFKMFMMEAFMPDEDDDDSVLIGSGFDPSTLIADLEAGLFDAPSTCFAG